MHCPKCGKENSTDARYCVDCGYRMPDSLAPRTWMPKAGGVIAIVIGSFYSALFIPGIFITAVQGGDAWSEFGSLMAGIYIFIGPMSIMAIIGGIFAIKRRRWPLAVAGAACAIISPFMIGIAALVLILLSRNEFMSGRNSSSSPG
jgi:hypothetical protein